MRCGAPVEDCVACQRGLFRKRWREKKHLFDISPPGYLWIDLLFRTLRNADYSCHIKLRIHWAAHCEIMTDLLGRWLAVRRMEST